MENPSFPSSVIIFSVPKPAPTDSCLVGALPTLPPVVVSPDEQLEQLLPANLKQEKEQSGLAISARILTKRLLVYLACQEVLPQRLTFLIRRLRHE